MKLNKRIRAVLLCALFLCSMLALCACGKGSPDGSSQNGDNVTYRVTVVDGLGQPYTEKVIVKFMSNGTQTAMAIVDGNGVASKELPKGDYTLEIASTESGSECWFDHEAAVLSAETTELEVVMAFAAGGASTTLTATAPGTETTKEYEAYEVGAGSSYVQLTEGDRTYVLFTPTEGGVYHFSVIGSAQIGYYGAPHFVQPNNLEEVVDNGFDVSVSNGSISTEQTGTARLVIGLDAQDGAEGAVLNIQRTGDMEWNIADEPWSTYQAKREITPYTLPEGVTLKYFDLTAPTFAYTLVLNETDRCYHLGTADGPAVFVQLDKEVYGISLKNMVGEIIYQDGVLMQSGVTSFRYMYNNGEDDFFKEDYTDVMRQYVTNRDSATGVYPMTEDLYYMLTKGIEFIGWCDPFNNNYRFAEVVGVNKDISWLFLCMYLDQGQLTLDAPIAPSTPVLPGADPNPGTSVLPGVTDHPGSTGNSGSNDSTGSIGNSGATTTKPVEENKSNPIEIGGKLEFNASVKANHLVHHALYKVTDTTLTINDPDAYVVYKGKTYRPVNGVVIVPGLYSASTNVPVKLAIGNSGSVDKNFYITMSYPVGHRMNPYQLTMGSMSTYSAKDNNTGVFYSFKATKAGTLTIRLDSVSGGNTANIAFTSEITEGGTRAANLAENANPDGKSVSFQLAAGEGVIISIAVDPVNFDYPEATIHTTVTFN